MPYDDRSGPMLHIRTVYVFPRTVTHVDVYRSEAIVAHAMGRSQYPTLVDVTAGTAFGFLIDLALDFYISHEREVGDVGWLSSDDSSKGTGISYISLKDHKQC